jgi:hypothetical protein
MITSQHPLRIVIQSPKTILERPWPVSLGNVHELIASQFSIVVSTEWRFTGGDLEAYAKVSLKKYKPMAAWNEDRNVASGLL